MKLKNVTVYIDYTIDAGNQPPSAKYLRARVVEMTAEGPDGPDRTEMGRGVAEVKTQVFTKFQRQFGEGIGNIIFELSPQVALGEKFMQTDEIVCDYSVVSVDSKRVV